jgi:UDP-N-acetylglucosamine acyltransferase
LTQIEKQLEPIKEIQHWIAFCKSSKRGLLGLEGVTKDGDSDGESLEE